MYATVKSISTTFAAAFMFVTAAHAQQSSLMITELKFVDHITAGMYEQDALVEKKGMPAGVYRINKDELEKYKDLPAYGTATPTDHAPFSPTAVGPFRKGKPLVTRLSKWLAGTGTANYSCKAGKGRIEATFTNLMPNGVYTMWNFIAGKRHMGCLDCPWATIDFPIGKPDGSTSIFKTDAKGNASYSANMDNCLELGSAQLMSGLAITYHGDGKTYGKDPGKFGTVSHVQLFTALPDQGAWQTTKK